MNTAESRARRFRFGKGRKWTGPSSPDAAILYSKPGPSEAEPSKSIFLLRMCDRHLLSLEGRMADRTTGTDSHDANDSLVADQQRRR